MLETLTKILATRRCHNSPGELAFLQTLHDQLKKLGVEPKPMSLGNVVCAVPGTPKKGSHVLFSCHVDTCHSPSESTAANPNKLVLDQNKGHIFLDPQGDSSCLGADDGAGIYIMLRMIEAKVPGTYIFHRGEEKGCMGSRKQLEEHREWLEQFDACIAFDRPNTTEVIITQSGLRCASKEYGAALALAFNNLDETFKYATSELGSVTDSKMYASVIPECINIGVGYWGQHTNREVLDWGHLEKLADACTKLKWSDLKPSRDPSKTLPPPPLNRQPSFGGFPQGRPTTPVSQFPSAPPRREPPKAIEPDEPDYAEMDAEELRDVLVDEDLVNYILRLRYRTAKAEFAVEYLEEILGVQ